MGEAGQGAVVRPGWRGSVAPDADRPGSREAAPRPLPGGQDAGSARRTSAQRAGAGRQASALARAYTLSAVKPHSLKMVPAGADVPKWSMPST